MTAKEIAVRALYVVLFLYYAMALIGVGIAIGVSFTVKQYIG